METINTEAVVTSLFRNGFDSVDPLLFCFTVATLKLDDKGRNNFPYEDRPLSEWFSKTVEIENGTFKFKDGYTLDSEVLNIAGKSFTLSSMLRQNKELTEYLGSLDFSKIVSRKVEFLGEKSVDEYPFLYSKKEREIIKNPSFKKRLTPNE